MYMAKITFIMLHRGNYQTDYIKNAKINPCKIADFRKYVKIYTRESIYVHSRSKFVFAMNMTLAIGTHNLQHSLTVTQTSLNIHSMLLCFSAANNLSAHRTTQYEKLAQDPSDNEEEDDVLFRQGNGVQVTGVTKLQNGVGHNAHATSNGNQVTNKNLTVNYRIPTRQGLGNNDPK